MLEETAVFCRQCCLDQNVWNFIQRHRVVMKNAAFADFLAVCVEEFHAEFAGEELAFVELLQGGQREGEHDDKAAGAERQRLAGELVQKPFPPRQPEAREKACSGVPPVLQPRPRLGEHRIDLRIDAQPIDQLVAATLLEEPVVQSTKPCLEPAPAGLLYDQTHPGQTYKGIDPNGN